MNRIKRAIILAAGIGKRMQPLTLECPKPLIPVNGESFIDRSIRLLREKGIREFYIICGYKKEVFEKHFEGDPDVHIVENPDYLKGNNITSMYYARKYLPESVVLEGDLMIADGNLLEPEFEKSGYVASWMAPCPRCEWRLVLENGRIRECDIEGGKTGYRLWGVSFWDRATGSALAEEIETRYRGGERDCYWDEIALIKSAGRYDLGIRAVSKDALYEIDTIEELASVDSSYKPYLN